MTILWNEGLRILFGVPDRCVRINLGWNGYIYWERNGKHDAITLWPSIRRLRRRAARKGEG